jgi:photosystem II stability/assembly factor-like uncharacterized protein
MNRQLFILIGVFSFSIFYGCDWRKTNKNNQLLAAEVITVSFIEGEKDQNRKEWIDKMHRIEPSMSWEQQDIQVQLERQKKQKSGNKNKFQGQWRERGSNNQAGRMHLSEYDKTTNMIYAASSGGNIWKSDLSGNNWHSINDFFRIPGITMLRIIPHKNYNRILVASNIPGGGFFYSNNDGETWKVSTGLNNINSSGFIKRAVVSNDKNRTIYLLVLEKDSTNSNERSAIYKSTNQGENFSAIKYFSNQFFGSIANFDIWIDYYSDCPLYIIENQRFHSIDLKNKVTDLGNLPSFTESGEKVFTILTGVKTVNGTFLYTLICKNGQSQIYSSSNGGKDWKEAGNIPQTPFMTNSFACSLKNPDKVYFGGTECYKSDNKGDTWKPINKWVEYYNDPKKKLHADIPGINVFSIDGNEIVFVTTDGGIYISRDNLLSVKNISQDKLLNGQYYSTLTSKTNKAILHAGSQDQGYQKVTNNNGTGMLDFVQIVGGDFGHIVSSNDGQSIWMVYPGLVKFFPDINHSNTSYSWRFNKNISGQQWMPYIVEDPLNPNRVYLAGGGSTSGAHIYHLFFNGKIITHSESTYDFSEGKEAIISAIDYSSIHTKDRYVMTSTGAFYTSNDDGINWKITNSYSPSAKYFYGSDILVSKLNKDWVYIAGSGYSNPPVYLSIDNGKTFTSISNGLPNTLVFALAANTDETKIYAATQLGPYVYLVSQNQWYELAEGIAPDQVYWSVEFIDEIKTARYGTFGRGIWDYIEKLDILAVNSLLASNITSTSATCNGEIISDEKSSITSRGICWSTTVNPTVAGNSLVSGAGTGKFNITIQNLIPNTIYHYRAYAKNTAGTTYGNNRTFTTLGV